MRLIDADALTAEIKSMNVTISGRDVFPQEAKASVVDHIRFQPTIDNVAKNKVIACVTGIIEGYSDAHIITCAICGLPFPDYGLEETTECRWCNAKSRCEAYTPCGPGSCTTSEDRKQKTYDKLFSSQHHV